MQGEFGWVGNEGGTTQIINGQYVVGDEQIVGGEECDNRTEG